MRPHPVADGWAGSLFLEPITQAKPILLDDNLKVLALLRNERGELYCNCYGMIVKERKCHKCVGYVSESDTCRWVMSVHDAELVNGKPQWAETKPAPAVELAKVNNPSGTPVPEYCNLAAKECTHCKWESYWTGDGKWPCPNLGRDNGPREKVPPLFPAKPAKVKKSKCPDISTDCPERKECALNKFWEWRPCALQGVETPTAKPAKDPIAVLLDGKWYSDGKEISEVEARTGAPCDQEHACVIVADPKGKAYDSRYPCRCFHCKGNQGPCGSKCGLYPEGTTGGKHGGCCMVQHEAKSRAEVELGVT